MPTYDATQDYPVRNGAGGIIVAKPSAEYTPTAAPVRKSAPSMPSVVVVGVPFRITPGAYKDAATITTPVLVNLTRRPDGLYVATAPGAVSYSETPSNSVGALPAQVASGTAVANVGRLAVLTPISVSETTVATGAQLDLIMGVIQGAVRIERYLTVNGIGYPFYAPWIIDNTFIPRAQGPGVFRVIAYDEAGESITQEVRFTVTAGAGVVVPPTLNYSQAIAYVDQNSPYTGTPSNVTSVTSTGLQSIVLNATGTGAAITHVATGFGFADGKYFMSSTLSGMPTTDGIFVVVSFTLTAYGSSAAQLVSGTGSRVTLSDTAGTLRCSGSDDTNMNINIESTPYGTRFVIAGRMDDVLDTLDTIGTSGTVSSAAYTNTDPALGRIDAGRFAIGTLHRLAVVGRPEGGAWPLTMEAVFADFSGGGVTAPAPSVTSLEILPAFGQSENRPGVDAALADTIYDMVPGQVFWVEGMRTEAGAAVTSIGAGTFPLDASVPATGLASYSGVNRVSPAFTFQQARALRWRDAADLDKGVIVGDNGFGGMPIEGWDTASPTLPLGRNQMRWLAEANRLAGAAGITLTAPYAWLFQGTESKGDPGTQYRAYFDTVYGQLLTQCNILFGAAPRLIVIVNGADVNTNGDIYDTPEVQYQIALDYNAIIATWQRIYPIADANIHTTRSVQVLQGEIAEIAAHEVSQGRPWNITYSVTKSGATVNVSYAMRAGESIAERANMYDDFGGGATCPNFGFEVDGGFASASFSGTTVTLTLNNPSPAWFRCAQHVQDVSTFANAAGETMSAHRCTLFGSHTWPSRFIAGYTHRRPLPGFSGTFSGDTFIPSSFT